MKYLLHLITPAGEGVLCTSERLAKQRIKYLIDTWREGTVSLYECRDEDYPVGFETEVNTIRGSYPTMTIPLFGSFTKNVSTEIPSSARHIKTVELRPGEPPIEWTTKQQKLKIS